MNNGKIPTHIQFSSAKVLERKKHVTTMTTLFSFTSMMLMLLMTIILQSGAKCFGEDSLHASHAIGCPG